MSGLFRVIKLKDIYVLGETKISMGLISKLHYIFEMHVSVIILSRFHLMYIHLNLIFKEHRSNKIFTIPIFTLPELRYISNTSGFVQYSIHRHTCIYDVNHRCVLYVFQWRHTSQIGIFDEVLWYV